MDICVRILDEVKKAIIGKDAVILKVFAAMLAGGHILLEDIPGVGKTTLALAFSKAMSLDYSRVQFTPDILPSDIVGFSVPERESGRMIYKRGAVICNLFLADELNRATSRTQSALLEAMEEKQVTVDGISHPLPDPFIVIATQNPVGAAGTQLLPDSQLDRFTVKLSIGYPDRQSETAMLKEHRSNAVDTVSQVIDADGLAQLRRSVSQVYIADSIYDYIVASVAATRSHPLILRGASPRASIALASTARAMAWIHGRDYVVPEDMDSIYIDCMSHRVLLSPEGEERPGGAAAVLGSVLRSIPKPAIALPQNSRYMKG